MIFNLQNVFPGWKEAMTMMVRGEKRRFWIPEHLGPPDAGDRPRGDVVFDIEMIDIRRMPNAPEMPKASSEDVARTPSGATTERVETGTGDEYPGPDSVTLLHYTGWTTDGKIFDSSNLRNRPVAFPLDKVLPAFAETVQMMVVGEKRRVWIPDHLANADWVGKPEGMLVFEVRLLNILPPEALSAARPETIEKPGPGGDPGAGGGPLGSD
jgi:peptidylprolyl isomerase